MNRYTEGRNEASYEIDRMSSLEIVTLMNQEDQNVIAAINRELSKIAQIIDAAEKSMRSGGRLIYVGAGTSGRLGVLDASECPPTYGVPETLVVGIIAGGERAIRHAVEGAEDDMAQGAEDLKAISLTANDIVVGIAASGRTPYVKGALDYARQSGCRTAAIVNNPDSILSHAADTTVELLTGPEVVTGSTRLKAGSSQKMVLNMISTGVMIRLKKVYQNLMVDVVQSNEKLKKRALNIVMQATDANEAKASDALLKAGGSAKLAIAMILLGAKKEEAEQVLKQAQGDLRELADHTENN